MIVKRLGVLSVAKVYGAMTAAMGLLIGLFVAAASALGVGMSEGTEIPFLGAMVGIGALVILPLIYGLLGLVMGAISAALYNVFAGLVGGVRIDTE